MSLIKWFQVGAPMNIYYLYRKITVLPGEIEKCVPRSEKANTEYSKKIFF